MADEFNVMVHTDHYGDRESTSEINAGQRLASSAANGVISTVDEILSSLSSEGSSALSSAVTAINALSSFQPATIQINYAPPSFENTVSTVPTKPSIGSSSNSANSLGMTYTGSDITDISITVPTFEKPTLSSITIPAAPSLSSVAGLPVEPNSTIPTVAQAPELISIDELALPELTPPTLREFRLPVFTAPTLPDFSPPASLSLPEVPGIVVTDNLKEYVGSFGISEIDGSGTLVGHLLIDRESRQAVEVFSSRGVGISEDLKKAQSRYARERGELLNAAEIRRLGIEDIIRNAEIARAVLEFYGQLDGILVEANMAFSRSQFEIEVIKADVQVQLASALTALYNARITEFKTEVELYQSEMSSQIVHLEKWKAEVEAEIAKTKVNAQLGRVYSSQIEASMAQATMYEARVQALLSNVEIFRARMQAVELEAEVARTAVTAYNGKVDAYIASLSGIKAEFAIYEAKLKGVAAQNDIEKAKVQLSMADIEAAGASFNNAIAKIELDTEKLKAKALKQTAKSEEISLDNILESLDAQIQGDAGRMTVYKSTMDGMAISAKNEAIVDNYSAATRYYSQIADSIYKANEQVMRATISSTQAASMAMETAGKTAASLAQGAYSALHISASIQGAGRISGSEERQDRRVSAYTDMINSRESVEQILSA